MEKQPCDLCFTDIDFDLTPGLYITCPTCETEYIVTQADNHLRFESK